MRIATLFSAVILSLMPALASAQGEAITSIEAFRLNAPGASAEYAGLRHDMYGRYDSGFQYDATLSSGELADFGAGSMAFSSASLDVRYLWNGLVGPQIGTQHTRLDGISDRRTTAGIAGAYTFANGTSIDGALVSDTENFGDDGILTMNVQHALTGDLSGYAGLTFDHVDSSTMKTVELGMRYGISQTMFVDGSISHSRQEDIRTNALTLGIGFSF